MTSDPRRSGPSPRLAVGVVTLFPALMREFVSTSIVGRAFRGGQIEFFLEDLRSHGLGKHKSVDDTPYGGGAGMVLRADCVVPAIEACEVAMGGSGPRPTRVLLTPQGRRFDQHCARRYAAAGGLLLVCGRYEGFDARVSDHVDEELSVGDFVLAGGEVAAMAVIEASARLVPGVLGNEESAHVESFSDGTDGLLEFPQYTRPLSFRGAEVPEVLRGGNHARIERWRREQAAARTRAIRPDIGPRARKS